MDNGAVVNAAQAILTTPLYYVSTLIAIAIFVGGVVVAISKARFMTKDDCKEKCPSTAELVDKGDCEDKHEVLSSTLCRKIDVVVSDVGETKVDIEKIEVHISNFTLFMGRVQQYMKDQADRDKLSAIKKAGVKDTS